jgi:hypothetical protein
MAVGAADWLAGVEGEPGKGPANRTGVVVASAFAARLASSAGMVVAVIGWQEAGQKYSPALHRHVVGKMTAAAEVGAAWRRLTLKQRPERGRAATMDRKRVSVGQGTGSSELATTSMREGPPRTDCST